MGALIPNGAKRLYLDANIFIYAIEDVAPYEKTCRALLNAIDANSIDAVTSEITLAETLTVPIRRNDHQAVSNYLQRLTPAVGFDVVPVSRQILFVAAQFRAQRGWRLPDAIHLATAVATNCDVFVTNDARLRGLPIQTIQLADLTI